MVDNKLFCQKKSSTKWFFVENYFNNAEWLTYVVRGSQDDESQQNPDQKFFWSHFFSLSSQILKFTTVQTNRTNKEVKFTRVSLSFVVVVAVLLFFTLLVLSTYFQTIVTVLQFFWWRHWNRKSLNGTFVALLNILLHHNKKPMRSFEIIFRQIWTIISFVLKNKTIIFLNKTD